MPPDDDPAHLPAASRLVAYAHGFGDAELIEPLYVRQPDARPAPMTAVAIEIRRLELADLDAIDVIERRAYATPWSRRCSPPSSRKRSSICLGAFEGERLIGYIVNARYVDAWHVMNVAVDPDHRGRGVARRLLERLFELADDDERARLHARGARVQRRRDRPLREARIRLAAASAPATTPTTARMR